MNDVKPDETKNNDIPTENEAPKSDEPTTENKDDPPKAVDNPIEPTNENEVNDDTTTNENEAPKADEPPPNNEITDVKPEVKPEEIKNNEIPTENEAPKADEPPKTDETNTENKDDAQPGQEMEVPSEVKNNENTETVPQKDDTNTENEVKTGDVKPDVKPDDNTAENNDENVATEANEAPKVNEVKDDENTNIDEKKADDEPDDPNATEAEKLFKKLLKSESKSKLKKFLTQDIFDILKDKKTTLGTGLENVIKIGVDNLNDSIGVCGSDVDAYQVYKELFDPIIGEYHEIENMAEFKHPESNFNLDEKTENLDSDGNYVILTRVSVVRNLKGYPLRSGMTKEHVLELESKVKDVLEALDGDLKGKYLSLKDIDDDTKKKLIEGHHLFKKGDRFLEFWPEGRGIFFNDNKTFIVWINNEACQYIIILIYQYVHILLNDIFRIN